VKRLGWWLLLAVCGLYGLFAIGSGLIEILSWSGVVEAEHRAVPLVFVPHALSGGVALIAGALQFNQALRARSRRLHRFIGRTYVVAVWTASVGGLWSALFFDVSLAARAAFVTAAVLWFVTTTVALQQIRRRKVELHREWMTRSFALCLFFVTFEFWIAGLRATGLPAAVAYPLGLALSWSANLAVAELWIRSSGRVSTSPKYDVKNY
jgi:uncharacterized membrane protein